MFRSSKLFENLVLLVFSICIVLLAYVPSQSDFSLLAPLYFLSFVAYVFLAFESTFVSFNKLMITAIILRIVLCFSFPNLSDDIYRFIWDGQLIHHGINPFMVLPTELAPQVIPQQEALLRELNSPDYYSVYPPIAQFVFYCSTYVNGDWHLNAIIMKLFLLICELGSIFVILEILKALTYARKRVFIYALNPLILIELMGNLHFEAISVFFTLLCIYFIINQKKSASAIALSFGVAAKMLPLMFIPFMFKYLKFNVKYVLIFGASIFILFLPIIFGVQFSHFAQSLDLYFGKFEFNGSLYYLLRALGKWISGYNLIRFLGPALGLITVAYMFRLFLKQKFFNAPQLINVCLISICSYYFLSTTVHPWYLSIPLALSVFSGFRFVILWSALIFMSYINYSYVEYSENLWIVALEYLVVFAFLIWELRNKKGDLLESKPPVFHKS